ncbi:hypothetical protein D3C87_2076900 [compost metagenome]
MQEENGPFRTGVVHHHRPERDVRVEFDESDLGFLYRLVGVVGASRRNQSAEDENGGKQPRQE